jgi:type VI secretion system secreted protein Hcp
VTSEVVETNRGAILRGKRELGRRRTDPGPVNAHGDQPTDGAGSTAEYAAATRGWPVADDIFLKLDGVKGDSRDRDHTDEIELDSFAWGVSQPNLHSGGGGGAVGKAEIEELVAVAPTSSASPLLMAQCAAGKHSKTAVVSVRRAGEGGITYIKITMSDVMVSGYHIDESSVDGAHDHVTLRAAKVQFDYVKADPKGGKGTVVTGTASSGGKAAKGKKR